SFSNIHLAWFNKIGREEEEFMGGKTDPFNTGGFDSEAVATLAAWKGPVYSKTVPYDTTVVDESLRFKSEYHLQDSFFLSNGTCDYEDQSILRSNVEINKQLLLENGTVSISYYANTKDYFNFETNAQYANTYVLSNHTVLLVGWDDNFSRENFSEGCRPQNDGAWLIRNSWGTDWGDDGYFWLSYEDKTIDYGPFYNLESNDNYNRNYQHDTIGWCSSISIEDKQNPETYLNSAFCSNVFTAQESQQLEAVSFYTTDAATEYEISIYTGLTDSKNPVSGKKTTATQKGNEKYAGYHTIELNEAITLKKGEKFSVVIRLSNPNYNMPIPVELCPLTLEQKEPKYMGNGGESYVSADGLSWKDVAGIAKKDESKNLQIYITNVCIKAFTNPVSTVSYSLFEGPVTKGESLALSSIGADEIYYTTDNSDPTVNGIKYENPIVIDNEMSIKAVAKTNGTFGNKKMKTYTMAKSELVTVLYKFSGGITNQINLSDGDKSFNLSTSFATDTISLQPQGSDTISVNGVIVKSSDWSQKIPLDVGKKTNIVINSHAPGKTPTEYCISVYRSATSYDYHAETVLFDESEFTLTDTSKNIIHSNDCITKYISEEVETELVLSDKLGNVIHSEYIPMRPKAVVSLIDFTNECTKSLYGDTNEIATSPDMSDAKIPQNVRVKLTPGQNLYIRKYATNSTFKSHIVTLVVPARPEMPQNPGTDYKLMTTKLPIPNTVSFTFSEIGSDTKMGTGEKIALKPDYTLYLKVVPTEHSFASDVREVPIAAVPATPINPEVEQKTSTTVSLKTVLGAEYKLGSGDWQASPIFKGLSPNKEYTFFIRIAVTDISPSSESSSAVIFTSDIPTVIPSRYSFEVKYEDVHGGFDPIGKTLFFNKTGKFSRENIPLPDTYQAVNIPESPGDEWLNPTSLEFIDGEWKVTNLVVTIKVEKQACVKIVFKTDNGTVLDEVGYEKHFGKIGDEVLTFNAPKDYEITNENQYTVKITRATDQSLVANPTEITVLVKKIVQEKPQEPSKPDDKDNPQTSDNNSLLFLFIVFFVSSTSVLRLVIIKKKNIK
ncbi:MAG: lectin like domain-containing protein, partial [Oscillospiraceae bacterium]